MKAMSEIYVVHGCIGGSTQAVFGRIVWLVAALPDEEMAISFVEGCRLESLRIRETLKKIKADRNEYNQLVENGKIDPHKYDAKYRTDFGGTMYFYEKTALLEEF